MRLPLVILLALACASCAVPVRPIAQMEQGPDGKYHFIPDPDQEPHAAAAVGVLGSLLGLLGGPWGEAALAVTTALSGLAAGHHIGNKRGRNAALSPAVGKP